MKTYYIVSLRSNVATVNMKEDPDGAGEWVKAEDVLPLITKIQKALGDGIDEEAWHPGEHWTDAAVRVIEAHRKGGE